MKSLGIEPDSIQRVLEFTENLQLDKENLPPVKESTHLYGKIFGSRLLREWLQNSRVGAAQVRDVERLSAQFQMSVEDDLRLTIRSDNYNASDVGSSYLTTYAFSVYLNLAQPPDSKLIEKAIRIHALLGDHPLEVPYYPRRPTKSDKETKRGASARAVTFYLALYRTVNTPEQKNRFRRILLDAIVNFSQYSPDLSIHAMRGRTSTSSGSAFHMGSDHIAPYYYFPNLPFATAAIALLLSDPNLTLDEQKTLTSAKESILQRILMMQNQDGTFRLVDDYIAHSTGAYTHPLAGLALIPLIEKCNGKQMKSSLGIIENSSLQENTNSQRKLIPHNSNNSHTES